ncbi:hypothetical protein B484DRAFT_401363 [Ochromonadaceae sp. CCMP2298]|nr:hypothetical protein B484DRAFT_401363 [Ochromonadaceae sp. CCMP2298]
MHANTIRQSRGGRTGGIPNYKKGLFIDVMQKHLPLGRDGWLAVQASYWTRSEEVEAREIDMMKRYWFDRCPMKGIKPTGDSASAAQTRLAQNVAHEIHRRGAIATYGGGDSEGSYSGSEMLEQAEDYNEGTVQEETAAASGGPDSAAAVR